MNQLPFVTRLRSLLHFGSHVDPERDWFTLLACVALALVGIVVWNVWTFDTVVRGGSIGAQATSAPPVLDSAPLDTVQRVFGARASEEAKYQTGAYRFVDPSQ